MQLTDSGGPFHVPALAGDNPIDTTGAGDYWAAGFLFGYPNGYSLVRAGRLGALLGSRVVEHMEASLPDSAWDRIILETTLILMEEPT
jgi:sugar/nucleoside kinase (ribokinase family)